MFPAYYSQDVLASDARGMSSYEVLKQKVNEDAAIASSFLFSQKSRKIPSQTRRRMYRGRTCARIFSGADARCKVPMVCSCAQEEVQRR